MFEVLPHVDQEHNCFVVFARHLVAGQNPLQF